MKEVALFEQARLANKPTFVTAGVISAADVSKSTLLLSAV
jgi:hypothetical protein